MSDPSISVVIPTRNRATLLRRALGSVAVQRFSSVEAIVVDDGDGCAAQDVAAEWPGLVTALSSRGAGQVAARTIGVAAARGRWIAFLDDDDWWDDADHLARMVAAASGDPCLVYASGTMVFEEAAGRRGERLPFVAQATPASLRRDNQILVSGMMYERRLHEQVGAFDGTLPIYWDWDWYLRVAAQGVAFRPAASHAVCISVRSDSTSAEVNRAEREADLARLATKHALTGLKLRNHESIARDDNRSS